MRRPLPQVVEPPPPVRLLISGDIALITLDHAPVNALSEQVRIHLRSRVQEACDNAEIKFIVLMAAKGARCFSSGADIKEFSHMAPPYLPDVLNAIESSRKLIIAAIDGATLGGGFELAMACHYRIATSRATFALPEIKLGIVPGAGGTQRLPRLVGVEKAVEWICSGRTVSATEALVSGAIDQCLDVTLLEQEFSSSSSSSSSSDDDNESSSDDSDDSSTASSTSSSSSSSSSSSRRPLTAVEAAAAREDRVWTHLLGAAISFGKQLLREEKLRIITNAGKARQPLLRRTSALTAKLGLSFVRSAVLTVAARRVAAKTPPGMVSPLLALAAIRHGLASPDFKSGLKVERAILMEAFATPQASALMHLFFAARDIYQLPPSLRMESRQRRRQTAPVFSTSGNNVSMSPGHHSSPQHGSARHQRPSAVESSAPLGEDRIGGEVDPLAVSVRSETRSLPATPLSPAKSTRASRRPSLSRASSMAYAGPHAPPAGFVNLRRMAFLGHTRRTLRLTAAFLMRGVHVTIIPVPLFDLDLSSTATGLSESIMVVPTGGRHSVDDDVEVPLEDIETFMLECLTPHSREALEALQAVLEDMSFMTPAMLARLGKSTNQPLTDPAAILLQRHMRVLQNVDEELVELDEVDIFLVPRPVLLGDCSKRVRRSAASDGGARRYDLSVRTLLVRLEGITRAHALFLFESRDHVRMALDVFSSFRLDRIFLLFSYPVPALKSSRLSHHPVQPTQCLSAALWELQAVVAVPSSTAVESILRFAKSSKLILVVTRMRSPSHAEREEAGMDVSGVWSREPSLGWHGNSSGDGRAAHVPITTPLPSQSLLKDGADSTSATETDLQSDDASTGGKKVICEPSLSKSTEPTKTPPSLLVTPPTAKKTSKDEKITDRSPITPLLSEGAARRTRLTSPPALSALSDPSLSGFLESEETNPHQLMRREQCTPIGVRLFARALFPLLVLLETGEATVADMEAALTSMGFTHGAFLTLQFIGLEEVWEEICLQQSLVAESLQPVSPVPASAETSDSSSSSPLMKSLTEGAASPLGGHAASPVHAEAPLSVPALPIVSALFEWLLEQRYGPQSADTLPVMGWYTAVTSSEAVGPVEKSDLSGAAGVKKAKCDSEKKKKKAKRHAHRTPTSSSSSATPSLSENSSHSDDEEGREPGEGRAVSTPSSVADVQPVAAAASQSVEWEYQETTKFVLDDRVSTKLAAIRQAHASRGTGVSQPALMRGHGTKPLEKTEICHRFLYAMVDELICVQRFNGTRDVRVLANLSGAEQQAYRDTPRMLALRCADLDVLSVQIFGFPAWYGGIAFYATEPHLCSLFVVFRFLLHRHREEKRRQTNAGTLTPVPGCWAAHPSPALKMSMLIPPAEMWSGRSRQKERRPTVSFNTVKVDIWT